MYHQLKDYLQRRKYDKHCAQLLEIKSEKLTVTTLSRDLESMEFEWLEETISLSFNRASGYECVTAGNSIVHSNQNKSQQIAEVPLTIQQRAYLLRFGYFNVYDILCGDVIVQLIEDGAKDNRPCYQYRMSLQGLFANSNGRIYVAKILFKYITLGIFSGVGIFTLGYLLGKLGARLLTGADM